MSRYGFGHGFAREYSKKMKDAETWAIKGGLLGAGIGGGLGALGAGLSKAPPALEKEDKHHSPERRKAGHIAGLSAVGALLGGQIGAENGARYGMEGHGPDSAMGKTLHKRYLDRLQENSPAAHEAHFDTLGMSGDEKHKSEAVKKFRSALSKAHPDRGGSNAAFIKARKAEAVLKASKWFKKLATSLPALSAVKRQAKRSYDWKPSFSEKVKEYFRHEPEFGKVPAQIAGIGAGTGAVTGLVAGTHRSNRINQAEKEKAITKEEATNLRRKHGVLSSVLKGAGTGVAAGLIPHYALHRRRPGAGILIGQGTAIAAPLMLAGATGPHGPMRSKAEDKYTKFDDKKDVAQHKKWNKK